MAWDRKEITAYLVDVDTGDYLDFQYNPNDIVDEKSTAYAAIKIPGMSHPRYQYVAGEPRKIGFKLVFFKGWQRKRLEVLDRDEFRCRWCGDATSTLHVHHVEYEAGKEPWDYVNELLITLCEHCHESESRDGARGDYERALLSALRKGLFPADEVFDIAEMFHDSQIEDFTPNNRRWRRRLLMALGWVLRDRELQECLIGCLIEKPGSEDEVKRLTEALLTRYRG